MNNYKELIELLRIVDGVPEDLKDVCLEAANEIENLRDELCQRCGQYRVAHMGGCNGCRYE